MPIEYFQLSIPVVVSGLGEGDLELISPNLLHKAFLKFLGSKV
jgi:hypothetical protein